MTKKNEQQAMKVFEVAAELFSVLSTPVRLQILSSLCEGEKSVGQMLATIQTTQPNLSQHLNVLYRTGVIARRREGTQVIYRVLNERATALCRAVCVQIAIELEDASKVPAQERLVSNELV